MVTQYGMSEKFGLIGLESIENRYLDGRAVMNCSDTTAAEVDQEVIRILKECYEKAEALLAENLDVLHKIAEFLIREETITGKEFMRIFREIKGIPEEDSKENTIEEERKDTTIEAIDVPEEVREEHKEPHFDVVVDEPVQMPEHKDE